VLGGYFLDWTPLNGYHVHHLNLLSEGDFLTATTSLPFAWRSRLLEVSCLEGELILQLTSATIPELLNQLLKIAWLQALLLPILLKILLSSFPDQLSVICDSLAEDLFLPGLELVRGKVSML
jgi:hypothetical protein